MNTDTVILEPVKRIMEEKGIRLPSFVIIAILGVIVSMQGWILSELVSGRERLVRIETKLERLER